MSTTTNSEKLKSEWLDRLDGLVNQVAEWAQEEDWSTKRIETRLKSPSIGQYSAPALVMQKETVKVLLEPITHSAPGADGVVDLYLMPGLDDIASFYHSDDGWMTHYMSPNSPTVQKIREATAKPLTKETLSNILKEMSRNGS
ncbi:MAG: hypothetical protein HUJ26_16560 [Planctomycetaceae bacterium]|nr:hypothetical protein [Planctomycetaceae bacterium]